MSGRPRGVLPLVVAFALLGVGILLIEVDVGPQLLLSALGVAAFAGYVLFAAFWLLSPRRLSDEGPGWILDEDRKKVFLEDPDGKG